MTARESKLEIGNSKLAIIVSAGFPVSSFEFAVSISGSTVAEERSSSVYILSAAAALAVVVTVALLLNRGGSPTSPARPTLNEGQKAFLAQVVITDASMSAAENFLGHTVTYLDAKVTNKGTKTIRQLDLEMTFVDTLGQVVLRETARPVASQMLPLKPGETRAFQVSFEHMPMDWNQAPPAIKPTSVQF